MTFDVWQSERALHDAGDVAETLRALDAKGYIDRRDDAVWLKTTALWGDDKDRVVVKSDGLPTYLLADIAYHRKKLARGFDELARHLGLRPPRPHRAHAGGAEGVRLRPRRAARDPDPERQPAARREEVKMGKRAGEFVTLDDVIEEVGRDATRYFYLMRRHDTPLEFDLEVAKRQSMDNPVYYAQYGHARCAAIRRRAVELEAPRCRSTRRWRRSWRCPRRSRILRRLADFPDFVADAAAAREPHRVTTLPDRPGGRVPELLHPPAEGARRHHPAAGAPPDRRLAAAAGTGARRPRACTGSTAIAQVMRNALAPPGRVRPRRDGQRGQPGQPTTDIDRRKRTIHDGAIHCGR